MRVVVQNLAHLSFFFSVIQLIQLDIWSTEVNLIEDNVR